MEFLSREQIAARIARDIAPGSYVNLGIGMPTLISNYLKPEDEIVLHSENGLLGMGPIAEGDEIDIDLTNAGKVPVKAVVGASFFDSVNSFMMMRGGRLDLCVLGAMEVASNGDLANWSLNDTSTPAAVGGAMDLAVGAKKVYAMTTHVTRSGAPKIVENCTLPLTGKHIVDRIYTDLAVIQVTPNGLQVLEKLVDISNEKLQSLTGAPLSFDAIRTN